MSAWVIVIATLSPVLILSSMVAAGMLFGRIARGPVTEEREAIQDAPAVVAGSDLDWQLDLARIYRDYDGYRVEHRMPGEKR